jgi:DNA repair exonuclease SbcCD ATPase subunit
MSKREDAEFDEWKKETRGKLSPSVQAQFDALTGDPTSKEVFRGYLREGEFYTRLNETKAEADRIKKEKESLAAEVTQFQRQRTEIASWWQNEKPKNERLVEEKKKLEEKVQKLEQKLDGLDPDSTDTGKGRNSEMNDDRLAEIEEVKAQLKATQGRLEAIDGNLPRFVGSLGKVIRNSIKEGFDIDPDKIVELSLNNGADPEVAYYQLTYADREKRAKEDFDKKLKDAEEKGRREALSTRPSQDFLRPAGPTVVDRIREKSNPTDRRQLVDAAVEEFRALRSAAG